jgi:hypothetical protein
MSYYSSFYQPPTPCPPWFDDDVRSRTDDFIEFQGGIPEDDLFGNKDVQYPQSTPSSMRSLNCHHGDYNADNNCVDFAISSNYMLDNLCKRKFGGNGFFQDVPITDVYDCLW